MHCWVYTFPMTIGDVVFFPQGWYVHTIMHICLFLTFIFIQHHHPNPILYVPNYDTQSEIVPKAIIPVPPSCALLSFSCTLCVATAWRSVSNMKKYANRLLWSIRYHCFLHSVPDYRLASSTCTKFRFINFFLLICWEAPITSVLWALFILWNIFLRCVLTNVNFQTLGWTILYH